MRSILCLAMVAGLGSTCHANLTLSLRPVQATYYYPDLQTPYTGASFSPSSFVIGPGVETIGDIERVTMLPVDFEATRLTITLNTVLPSPTFGNAPFNGILFDLIGPGTFGIAGTSVNGGTTLGGFTNDRVTYTSNQIGINWNSLSYRSGDKVIVDFTFNEEPTVAAVPEPSTVVYSMVGLICWGAVEGCRRWRKRVA